MRTNMKTFKMLGGGKIQGDTPESIIENIRSFSFNPKETIEEFMESVSEACRFYNEKEISTINAEIFLQDLVVNRFLKFIPKTKKPARKF